MVIGIGTTFDYALPFEPMCRMIAKSGFRAITIGGGDIAHSGYDTEEGRARVLGATGKRGLRIDSLHAPFGPDVDLSAPDIRTETTGSNQPVALRSESDAGHADIDRGGPPPSFDPSSDPGLAPSTEAQMTGEQPSVLGPRFSYRPAEQRLRAIDRVKMAVDAATALRTGIVIVHPCERFPAEETRARIHAAKDSLKQLVAYAGERSVRLALENLPSPLSMQVFETVLENVPELGVCYDTSHAQVAGDTFGVIGRHRDRIVAVHVSDNRGSKDDHMLPFEGVLPWEEFAHYLPRLKNLGCFMLEVEIRESAFKDSGEFLAEAFRRARHVLDLTPADRQLPTGRAR
jgi:sugar phosphate isomerase/epimerase